LDLAIAHKECYFAAGSGADYGLLLRCEMTCVAAQNADGATAMARNAYTDLGYQLDMIK
jgi:hypothetical protein